MAVGELNVSYDKRAARLGHGGHCLDGLLQEVRVCLRRQTMTFRPQFDETAHAAAS